MIYREELQQSSEPSVIFSDIVEAVSTQGYVIVENVFSSDHINSLLIDIKNTSSDSFRTAAIGRDSDEHVNRFVRNDRIHWIDRQRPVTHFYLDWIEQLRQEVNRSLFLGLFDYECHYAHYPQGAFYKKHVDAFKGQSNRVLTTILYLNPDWQQSDGGELVLYADDGETVLETVYPTHGKMVVFLSERFPHEVLPAKRSRYSLTGWFRINQY